MIARYFLFFIIICLTTSIITGLHGIATVGLGHCAGLPDCGPILYLLLSYTSYYSIRVHTTYREISGYIFLILYT